MSDAAGKTWYAYVEEDLQAEDPEACLALIQPADHHCQGGGRNAAAAEHLSAPNKLE